MVRITVLLFALLFAVVVHCTDLDGDGFHSEYSYGVYRDCCDSVDDGCYDPYLINPGAWEVPNNGQADRCIAGLDAIPTNLPCDSRRFPDMPPVTFQNAPKGLFQQFVGPEITPPQTERAVIAMDICEFKDDDDDPSWGFARQENMIFSLANSTRNGYDIFILGPDNVQVSVLSGYGHIEPANGEYLLAISSGQAWSSDYQGNGAPGTLQRNYQTTSTIVTPQSSWFNRPHVYPAGCDYSTASAFTDRETAYDSIMATFAMQQPTNMRAFSFKIAYFDADRPNLISDGCVLPDAFSNPVIVLKNDTVGTPTDGNILYDQDFDYYLSTNERLKFFEICEFESFINTAWPNNICPIDYYYLEFTQRAVGTQWKTVGTAATPGRPFQLKIATWDQGNSLLDNTVLLDDYIPVAEQRDAFPRLYGYQFTSDIGLEHLTADRSGFYPANANTVTFTYTIKNYGPEQTSDIYINLTPPRGTSLANINGQVVAPARQAEAPYTNNSFYRYRASGANIIAVGQSITGTVTFNILPDSPANLQFRVTATCSSIEKVWGNNHQTHQIYIDKL